MPTDSAPPPTAPPRREDHAPTHDRAAHMISTLRQYRDEINRPGVGNLEFHFHDRQLKLKLTQVFAGESSRE